MTAMAEGSPQADLIVTERLLLRPKTREEALISLGGGTPAGLTYAEGYPDQNALEALQRFVSGRLTETPAFIIRRAEGDVIGGIGYWFPSGPRRPSVGYDVAEALRGRGYATEALRGLLVFLLGQPGIEAVEADALVSNIASRRVMEKAGMTHFDTRPGEDEGRPVTLVYYEARRP